MAEVPAACIPLANQLRDKQAEYDAAFAEWDVTSGPGEKGDLQRRLDALLSEIESLSIQLRGCIISNGPQPDPMTTPTLSIVGIEVVQSIQTDDNRIPIVDGPAVVRVRVDSGVRNNFNAGAGPNGWPHIFGSLTVTEVFTNQRNVYANSVPSEVTARPTEELNRNSSGNSLNFLIGIPVGSRELRIEANVVLQSLAGSAAG